TFTHYTAHILSTTALPFSVLLLSLLLISRLKKQHPHLRGAEGSECRLLVCALMTGMKLLLDNTYTNRTWEKVCGIPVAELNVMEMEFLVQLDFNIHVSESEYYRWLQHIEHAVH
ncbi:cyclin PHO80-like protein, partial [Powellomyces hirtus]